MKQHSAPIELRHEESVELLQPALIQLANRESIRALVIKGRTLADQGLRRLRRSSDTDLLVSPADFEAFRSALGQYGWEDRDSQLLPPLPQQAVVFAQHSVTLLNQNYPSSVDLHRFFPGFLKPPQEVFDALWDERAVNTIAHMGCWVPSRHDHWIIAMLHMLRSPEYGQLAQLRDWLSTRSESEQIAVVTRAARLGALEPLRAEFIAAQVQPQVDGGDVPASVVADWHRLISREELPGMRLLTAIRLVPWRERPRVIWRSLFPPESAVRVFNDLPPGPWSLFRFYVNTLWRAACRAPATLRYMVARRNLESPTRSDEGSD